MPVAGRGRDLCREPLKSYSGLKSQKPYIRGPGFVVVGATDVFVWAFVVAVVVGMVLGHYRN